LNGRELSVASYLEDHVAPCLIGKDAGRIEDIWQYLYRGCYWRRGAVTMTAIAAIDTALWDIKAKAANMPLYELLGGKSRDGVMVYGHANGSDIAETVDQVAKYKEMGYKAIRAQTGVPGLSSTYGVSKDKMYYGGISHLKKIFEFAAMHHVRSGSHGATDLSPVCMGAALHLDTAIYNFGVQEYMRHTEKTDEVFPHAYTFKDGYLYPGDTPGHGVDIDEELAAKYPYERAYLPVNRLEDGSMFNW